jgi:hypothetical protein
MQRKKLVDELNHISFHLLQLNGIYEEMQLNSLLNLMIFPLISCNLKELREDATIFLLPLSFVNLKEFTRAVQQTNC